MARAWALAKLGRVDHAKPLGIDEGWKSDFADLGLDVEVTLAADGSAADVIEIWEPNARIVNAFLACATQWRMEMGPTTVIWLGLDYAGVDVVLGKRRRPGMFADIQVMENAALTAFNEAQP